MKSRPELTNFQNNLKVILRNDQNLLDLFDKALNYFHHIEKCNGLSSALKMSKEVLRLVSRCFLRQDTSKQLGPFWIATNKLGIPRHLRLRNKEKYKTDPHYQRLILTVLSYYKLISDKVDNSISTIISPQKSSNLDSAISDINKYIPKILKDLRIESFTKSDSPSMNVTTKAGANGPRAMVATSILALQAVLKEGLDGHILNMVQLVYTDGRVKEFNDLFDLSKALIDPNIDTSTLKALRLHFLIEGGGKTRVICIGDIWTQIALKPIHDYIMKMLKRLPGDGSFSHNNLATKLKN